ncbi:MAG: glycerol kinase [Acidobacteriota bacterium]|nr:glycerol kinase [Acidobacteriota bacterium]MDE3106777.1 glycerol kinase [Acidobacteriota bacterium]
MRALTIDVGTSSVRAALVSDDGNVSHVTQRPLTLRSPSPGEVELDAAEIASVALELAHATLRDGGRADVVAITNQRATTIVFDHRSGQPVGPALGWQDLRTVFDCLILQGEGIRLAPNQTATKAAWLVKQSGVAPEHLRVATIETWIAWHLSRGESFVTDRSNASVTGLVHRDLASWDLALAERLDLPSTMLATLVDTMGTCGRAVALDGAPPIVGLVGDQPASLFGQSLVNAGAKITFGTGAMLDMVSGEASPATMTRFDSGCFPTVMRSRDGVVTWGVEAIDFSAGSCVQWLRDELQILDDVNDTSALATSVPSADGVFFVPAFNGLGTPQWDFGARGAFFGLTRGSSRAHLVRAVLDGVAQRGVDLVEAAETHLPAPLAELRVDGGMTANPYFVQRLADLLGRPVAVSAEREATTRGAGLMALVGAGALDGADVEALWRPRYVAEATIGDDERHAQRAQWARVVERAAATIPELSAISF